MIRSWEERERPKDAVFFLHPSISVAEEGPTGEEPTLLELLGGRPCSQLPNLACALE